VGEARNTVERIATHLRPGTLIITAICGAFLPHFVCGGRPLCGWQAPQQQVSVGEWFTFSPQAAAFSVTLPAMPTEKTKDIESGIRMRSYDLRTRTSEYCIVWMTGLPQGRPATASLDFLLPRALQDILKSAWQAGKKDLVTTSQKDITLNRNPGRESFMESASDSLDAKGYLVGHDFVALTVLHPKEQEASGEAARFFESLTLKNAETTHYVASTKVAASLPEVEPAIVVDKRPLPLNFPMPQYTDQARNQHFSGVVGVLVLVDALGRVQDARLINHLPYGLDEQAVKAVRQVRFKPAVKDGQNVKCWVILEVEFNSR